VWRIYSPRDVYNICKAYYADIKKLIVALHDEYNCVNWHVDYNGETAIHAATIKRHLDFVNILIDKGADINAQNAQGNTSMHLALDHNLHLFVDETFTNHGWSNIRRNDIAHLLLDRGADITIKNNEGQTYLDRLLDLHNIDIGLLDMILEKRGDDIKRIKEVGNNALVVASKKSLADIVRKLLDVGVEILNDIDAYSPNNIVRTDCRPMISEEIDNRFKKVTFDSFIDHHIEYRPYKDGIYSICYPMGKTKVLVPFIGWTRAAAIRDKYYFDEIFFYVHLHVAKVYTMKYTNNASKNYGSITEFANQNNDTDTLMTVLTSYLKLYLNPPSLHF
jgi:hypothetical protein